jgi:hypothetical protein
MKFRNRLKTGAIVAEVVHVGSLRKVFETRIVGGRQHPGEEVFLADVASICRILPKTIYFELVGFENDVPYAFLQAEVVGFAGFPLRKDAGLDRDGCTPLTQSVMGDFEQEGRINAAREGDGDTAQIIEIPAKILELFMGGFGIN